VIGVEKDVTLAKELITKFQNLNNISIVAQDFLEYELPKEPYIIFANIPFSLTSEIINRLLTVDHNPAKIFLIMQLEAAEKYSGEKGETMSSILTKPWYEVEILGDIDRTNFTQKPQVKIVFTRFKQRLAPFIKDEDKVAFRDFVNYGFMMWAPTISDAFKKVFTYPQIKTLEKMYKIAGKKPSQVSFDVWLLLFKTYRRLGNDEGKKVIRKFLKEKGLK
jgi:23S rRNA (adenine-N6)-dimethyltransferase